MAPNLYENITAIGIIDQVLKRNDHLTPGIVFQTVKIIRHSNKAHAKQWEDFLEIRDGSLMLLFLQPVVLQTKKS